MKRNLLKCNTCADCWLKWNTGYIGSVTAHVNVLLCFTQHSKNHFVWTLTKSASYHCDDTFCNDFQQLFSTTFVCSTPPLLVSSARTNRPSEVHDQSNVKLITKVYRELNFCGDLENLCTSNLVRVRLAKCWSKQKNKHKHNLCTNKSIRTNTTASKGSSRNTSKSRNTSTS